MNGEAGYAFLLSMVDGDVVSKGQADRLRLKAWRVADESLVYNNQLGAADTAAAATATQGGQVSIKSK